MTVRDYLIVHRGDDHIEILRVLHGRRDIAAELARVNLSRKPGKR
ncbi:MAG TPA: hypothetical protein VMQ73_07295 [Methylomirabilota bacterium]|nr:hypothetical protein [Methylomirabilota bacterium]